MDKKKGDLKVLNAIAAPQRLQILRAVYNQGSLSYVEIMNQLNLDPSRDAGKFAYHLRTLRKAGLLKVNHAKKYKLTSLGNLVIDFSRTIEEHTLREKGQLMVRTSRLAMEEFDVNKIVYALKREAGIPNDLARKIAGETEERLLGLDTLYLTAPLIREFVNALLIEKGLQEYRHKLTRLGLPVYNVTQLLKQAENSVIEGERIERVMGKNVMTEYVLLDVLPRWVADAHLSGQIHLRNIDMWVLKPDSFQHDLRLFFKEGYTPNTAPSMAVTLKPPKNLEDALALTSTIIGSCSIEVIVEQGISHFNLFLAPFVRNVSPDDLKNALRRFLFKLNQSIANRVSIDISLGIDLLVPPSIKNVEVDTIDGEDKRTYGEYVDESRKVVEAILNLMIDDSTQLLYHPQLIINLPPSSCKEEVEPLLLKAHSVAAKYGNLYFVNLTPEWQKDPTYFATGLRLASEWTGDFELDTMRTGSFSTVVINLPRIAYRARGEEKKFYSELNSYLDMAMDSQKMRLNAIGERINRHLLPFLSQKVNGESYFRVKNGSLHIGFVGLNEAVKTITGNQIYEDRSAIDFAIKIVKQLTMRTKELRRKTGLRVAVSQSVDDESPQRLAELDVEKFGWGTVTAQGTRRWPYYTDGVTIPLETDVSLRKRLQVESRFHPLLAGGHLSLIEIEEALPEDLFKLTREICQNYNIGAYAFTRQMSYCFNCKRVFRLFAQKCPECKAAKSFVRYSRLSSKYLPLELWPVAKMENVDKRVRYRLARESVRK